MPSFDFNEVGAPIQRLLGKGVRYSTVIDVGCADGNFFLTYYSMGLFPGAVPFNIDANSLYEESLKAIKALVGGGYLISAITDSVGEVELTQAVHPYWSSLRPAGDEYWRKTNDLNEGTMKVPATTLDALASEEKLEPPFLLKIDVQGGEQGVLAGARRVLDNSHVVICEADIDDFQNINRMLLDAGFILYDMTWLSRLHDGSLGWFYPVYINSRLEAVRPRTIWEARDNTAVIRRQREHRRAVLEANARILNQLRFRDVKIPRNEMCPCGSGRRFKHCCGVVQAEHGYPKQKH